MRYSVIAGNVGTVHQGNSEADARSSFAEYARLSRIGYGRVAGERVTLFDEQRDVILDEQAPAIDTED